MSQSRGHWAGSIYSRRAWRRGGYGQLAWSRRQRPRCIPAGRSPLWRIRRAFSSAFAATAVELIAEKPSLTRIAVFYKTGPVLDGRQAHFRLSQRSFRGNASQKAPFVTFTLGSALVGWK